MTKQNAVSGATLRPEAYVSTRKSRLPIYNGKTVYLKDSQEFELELFNPTTKTVGIYIKINGVQTSSSMLVIRPGMRYFLDRYIDEARKFAFNTYQAENTAEGKAATAQNGLIEISFYNEKEKLPPLTLGNPFITYTQQPLYSQPISQPITWPTIGTPTTGTPYYTGDFTTTTIGGSSVVNLSGSLSDSSTVNCCYFSSDLNEKSLDATSSLRGIASSTFETGRVEKGGASQQSFDSYYGDFEPFATHTVSWEIKPESQRAENLRKFCKCGKRIGKQSWKFCPSCGQAV